MSKILYFLTFVFVFAADVAAKQGSFPYLVDASKRIDDIRLSAPGALTSAQRVLIAKIACDALIKLDTDPNFHAATGVFFEKSVDSKTFALSQELLENYEQFSGSFLPQEKDYIRSEGIPEQSSDDLIKLLIEARPRTFAKEVSERRVLETVSESKMRVCEWARKGADQIALQSQLWVFGGVVVAAIDIGAGVAIAAPTGGTGLVVALTSVGLGLTTAYDQLKLK